MAKVTWLGEDALHVVKDDKGNVVDDRPGPSFTVWNGVKFPKGVPVDVVNPVAVAKAKGNPFFKVEGLPGRPPKVSDDDENKG